MNKKQQIIEEYKKTYTVHPSYGKIAKKLACSKSLVAKYVREYLASQRAGLEA